MSVEQSDPQTSDRIFAASMRELRDRVHMSQEALAEQMSKQGFAWHQATVYKIERGTRQIQLGEAVAVADVLGTPLELMTKGSEEALALSDLREELAELAVSANRLFRAVSVYEHDRARIEEFVVDPLNDVVLNRLSDPERTNMANLLRMTAEGIVADGKRLRTQYPDPLAALIPTGPPDEPQDDDVSS